MTKAKRMKKLSPHFNSADWELVYMYPLLTRLPGVSICLNPNPNTTQLTQILARLIFSFNTKRKNVNFPCLMLISLNLLSDENFLFGKIRIRYPCWLMVVEEEKIERHAEDPVSNNLLLKFFHKPHFRFFILWHEIEAGQHQFIGPVKFYLAGFYNRKHLLTSEKEIKLSFHQIYYQITS